MKRVSQCGLKGKCLGALGIAAAQAFVLIVGLIFLELVFGDWFHHAGMSRLNLPRNRSFVNRISDLYPDESPFALYRRDTYAFRGDYDSPSRIDILTMGGSTTDQRYLTEGKTWQDVLSRELSTPDRRISVVNAGIDGQTTVGHLRSFKWWFSEIPELSPKYILFYVGINDFFMPPAYVKKGLRRDRLTRNETGFFMFIEEHSALVRLWECLSGWWRARNAGLLHSRVDPASLKWTRERKLSDSEGDERMAKVLPFYEEHLRQLSEWTRSYGAVPVFVTQTIRLYRQKEDGDEGVATVKSWIKKEITGLDFRYLMHQLNQTTLKVCRESGGICIDLERELDFKDEDFYDLTHNTPGGAQKIGHYLAEKLKPPLQRNPKIIT